jgi:hypothetical protein
MMGSSQYFFLVLKKPHKSFKKCMVFLLVSINMDSQYLWIEIDDHDP